jgi:hypothetical protein
MRFDIDHRDDDTTGTCVGDYSLTKSLLRATGGEGQHVGKLVFVLLASIAGMFKYTDVG